jgi:hypothetical protein
MPTARTTSTTARREQLPVSLGAGVLAVLEEEAALVHLDPGDLLRNVLRDRMGLLSFERSPHAPARKLLPNKDPKLVRFAPTVDASVRGFLDEVCNRLGAAEQSAVICHFMLAWAGISPLDRGRVLPASTAAAPARSAGTGRRTTQEQALQALWLAPALRALLDDEAALLGTTPSDLLRDLVRAKMGVVKLQRSPHAPARKVLANVEHEKKQFPVRMPLGLIAAFDELASRLGTTGKSTIAAHLILDWANISPLTLPYPFESRRR